jgi:lipoate-protein ligase A
MWNVINSGAMGAQELMDKDKYLLHHAKVPTLHFYRFKNPSLTYGLLMKLEEHVDVEMLKRLHIEAGLRPTGGGALFHLWDLAFSVIIPLSYIPDLKTPLEKYFFINEQVAHALEPFLKQNNVSFLEKTPDEDLGERFCMAKPTQYDVMLDGKKMIGAAQRVTRDCMLHQGTISLCAPDLELLEKVLIDKRLVQKMGEQSFHLADFSYQDKKKLDALQTKLEASLLDTFNKNFTRLHCP